MKQYIRIHDRRKYISDFFVVDSSESLETIIKAVALKEIDEVFTRTGEFPKEKRLEKLNPKNPIAVLEYNNTTIFIAKTDCPNYEIEQKYIDEAEENDNSFDIIGKRELQTI